MAETKLCSTCGNKPAMQQRTVCSRCNYLAKKAKVDQWRADNPDRVRELSRLSRYRRYGPSRDAAIEALGSACAWCGIEDVRVLDIDHIFGGGSKERARKDRIKFYKEVVAGERDDAQLLCLNCHRIKTCEEHAHQ